MDETPSVSYYSEADPEIAILHLNPIGDDIGDFTLLGINALNNEGAITAEFELLAAIDVTAVSEHISDYADAVMTITLEQKQSDGTYGNALDISQYLTVSLEGISPDPISDDDTAYSAVIERAQMQSDNGAEIRLPYILCSVVTGSAFESAGLTYGNFRITVNIILRDEDENEYAVSRVSNFVIYTNAKIIPDYVTS